MQDTIWFDLEALEKTTKKQEVQKIFYNLTKQADDKIISDDKFKKRSKALFPSFVSSDALREFCKKHKNAILLVNHDSVPYGATHYLFTLYNILKSNGLDCCVLDETYNLDLYKKYNVVLDDVFSYEYNSFFIEEVCRLSKPKVIYLNSVNEQIFEFTKNKNYQMIKHSHEVPEYYPIGNPDYVVSKKIKKDYIKNHNHNPKVQPPILNQEVLDIIDEEIKKEVLVVNKYNIIDTDKICIGMCGQTDERKNPELFLEVAKLHPELNFIWVGGETNMFEDEPNIYHVKTTLLPFKYFMLFDYFMLFSKKDPCPYVVLENLYINNRIITFKDNICTNHKCKKLKSLYFEYNGEISLDSANYMIKNYVKNKATRKGNSGKNYILENFTKINKNLLDLFQ